MAFKVTQLHWELIVNFFEKNPGMARGRIEGLTGKETMNKLWQELTTELNAIGQGSRTSVKWKKSWVDFKYNLKRRALETKTEINGTGGGPPKVSPLTDIELRILNILGNSFFQGSGVPESGCNFLISAKAPASTSQVEASTSQVVASTSQVVASTSKKYNNRPPIVERRPIVRDHDYSRAPLRNKLKRVKPDSVDEMEKMYKETINELKAIKDVLKELSVHVHGIQIALEAIAKK